MPDARPNSTDAAEDRAKDETANRNLASISPFFIVKDLQVSISYYIERFGFQLDFQGPEGDPYYAGVSRDGIGIMLKAILPETARGEPDPARPDPMRVLTQIRAGELLCALGPDGSAW
ncbi:MAG TPA: hypothetical protein VI485_22715 [Vicinamibacterales bacterium]|nr:hypothetical protein [Vicinamibacterales bacterium]